MTQNHQRRTIQLANAERKQLKRIEEKLDRIADTLQGIADNGVYLQGGEQR